VVKSPCKHDDVSSRQLVGSAKEGGIRVRAGSNRRRLGGTFKHRTPGSHAFEVFQDRIQILGKILRVKGPKEIVNLMLSC